MKTAYVIICCSLLCCDVTPLFAQQTLQLVADFKGVRPEEVVFSPDGRLVAAAGKTNTDDVVGVVACWELGTKKEVFRYTRNGAGLASLSFRPGHNILATAGYGDDKDLSVFDVEKKRQLFTRKNKEQVLRVRFAPNGKLLAVAYPHDIVFLETDKYEQVQWRVAATDFVLATEFSGDSKHFACGDFSGTLSVWDVATAALVCKVKLGSEGLRTLCFSHRRSTLVAGDYAGEVYVVRDYAKAGRTVTRLKGQEAGVFSCLLTPDDRWLLAGGFHGQVGTVEAWSMVTAKLERSVKAHSLPVLAMALSSDGRTLGTGSYDSRVKVWRLPKGFLTE